MNATFNKAKENLTKNGFLNIPIDKNLDIIEEIKYTIKNF